MNLRLFFSLIAFEMHCNMSFGGLFWVFLHGFLSCFINLVSVFGCITGWNYCRSKR